MAIIHSKTRTLYAHPFSKAYWRDAALELKDTRMLILAALMIALRVALKPVTIVVMPNVQINAAVFANALGAMIFGPIVAIPAAVVSDTLGCLLFPTGVYFFPFVFEEIAGSVIFALFLYRARVTPTRVICARFCIDFFVNIVMNAPIMWLYYKMVLGKSYLMFQLPQILKNLFMFPVESVVITLFLSVMMVVTFRMKLTYDDNTVLKFSKKEVITLIVFFIIGVGSVFSYLVYYYSNNSRSASYTSEERITANQLCDTIVRDNTDDWDSETTITIVESAYRGLTDKNTTYTAAVYVVDTEALSASGSSMDSMWAYSKSKAAKDECLTRAATVSIVVTEKTGETVDFTVKEVSP